MSGAAAPGTNPYHLSLHSALDPDPVAIGETATLTITVINDAPDPATNLVVTLPTPEGALALPGPDTVSPTGGWRWRVGRLAGRTTIALTGTLRVVRAPPGDALLLTAQATADGLARPVQEYGGASVVDRARGPTTARFTPGAAAVLRSADGHVQVQLPARASNRALTLRHAITPLAGPAAPVRASVRRGLGVFYLDATDDADQAIHQFTTPLTITVSYTPEQLAARGFSASDLALFWYDATAPVTQTANRVTYGRWQALPTTIDPVAGTATALVDHFTPFELSDGSSPSTAFVPSLQGWQVSLYTGAATYSYPIDVPAGPAGSAPQLTLSYSSDATDGATGQRLKSQASWVGKGWSLDTGAVALNKIDYPGSGTINYYALVLNGQAFDLVRGAQRVSSPSDDDPSDWEWHATDERYLRVKAERNPVVDPTRGDGVRPRYSWYVWTKDGTRYAFSEDAWWGWEDCVDGGGDFAYMQAYKWALTSVTDPHGNAITYTYGRVSNLLNANCFHVSGHADVDLWPETITWAGGRYRVHFSVAARESLDSQFEFAENQIGGSRSMRSAATAAQRATAGQAAAATIPASGRWMPRPPTSTTRSTS